MLLKLKGVGNSELQQYADVSPLRILEVGSFAEASRKTLEYIKKWNLGSGNLVAEIFDKHRHGSQVASVSYNGKVWRCSDESCCIHHQHKSSISNKENNQPECL